MKKLKTAKVEVIDAWICDRCGREAKHNGQDFEVEEFVSISHTGGYVSIFGDQTRLSIDLCQYCLKDTLGEWLVLKDMNSNELS